MLQYAKYSTNETFSFTIQQQLRNERIQFKKNLNIPCVVSLDSEKVSIFYSAQNE